MYIIYVGKKNNNLYGQCGQEWRPYRVPASYISPQHSYASSHYSLRFETSMKVEKNGVRSRYKDQKSKIDEQMLLYNTERMNLKPASLAMYLLYCADIAKLWIPQCHDDPGKVFSVLKFLYLIK